MFQSMTSILTMSAMLLHSILGCCSHHAHACEHGHTVETCESGHDEHAGDRCERNADSEHGYQHEGHIHRGADGCLHENSESVEHSEQLTAAELAHDHDDVPACPHGPCQHECAGDGCSFTQTSEVRTPAPDDVGFALSGAFASVHSTPVSGGYSAEFADAGPPGLSVACCDRPLLQVWRL